MYAHSSKTEQASEITMTPALYRCTIMANIMSFSPHALNTCYHVCVVQCFEQCDMILNTLQGLIRNEPCRLVCIERVTGCMTDEMKRKKLCPQRLVKSAEQASL